MTELKSKEKSGAAGRFIETVGRRKTAVARVRLIPANGRSITVNGKSVADYFPTAFLRETATEAVDKVGSPETGFSISAKVYGGGIVAQAEAIRHGISRALVKVDSTFRKELKKAGFLKRDPRAKERRKFGLKKARKAPQWSKR